MKTEWVRTEKGYYMEIIVPEFEGVLRIEPPTEEEMIEASQRYIYARYVRNHPEEYPPADEPDIATWEGEGGAYVDDEE